MTLREQAELLEMELSSRWHDPKFTVGECRAFIEVALRHVVSETRDRIAKEIHRLYGSKSVLEDNIRAMKLEDF